MNSTLEARLIWQMSAYQLEEPEREYRFHPVRKWRFDFAWPGRMLALEAEGGQWVRGRHTRGRGYEEDVEKYNEAALLGWRVLRVTGSMVDDGRAVRLLERAMTFTPDPSPCQGEGRKSG